MILHFHAADVLPGEIDRLNIYFDRQNYNCDNYPESGYIEVNREDLFKLLQECDFNEYWYEKDLTTIHDVDEALLTAAIDKQADEASREDLDENEIIDNRFL